MFRHSMNIIRGFYVFPLHYVFNLMGFSPKGRSKMRQFFDKKTYFMSPFITIVLIWGLTINIRSSVLKKRVFRSM